MEEGAVVTRDFGKVRHLGIDLLGGPPVGRVIVLSAQQVIIVSVSNHTCRCHSAPSRRAAYALACVPTAAAPWLPLSAKLDSCIHRRKR